ncbi:peptidoglycan/xylan/chitin deacetylase (PgdA/CDA1 family) [Lachnospiraceae bacterium PM6-15]|uniref:Polysaccharide deacetylase n=1 Tax=Ohessyouella blattaphilus TaxID=2949333 RepID=A0ABT1EKZ5_9FIRM|nr:polysaccharide deacetylase family protein [Ohessyouella blattaphilus]MCP1111384.1 polysaccharide deacetylase [Ohessyouella blattaphilus]MCR8564778.1 polysaccharide deacetylase [Ohessyouella blattaphilus]MDL2250586.1 polysaccharide deacetylase [Lachnospiraceae bacterium OttesenSCG-928-J05]
MRKVLTVIMSLILVMLLGIAGYMYVEGKGLLATPIGTTEVGNKMTYQEVSSALLNTEKAYVEVVHIKVEEQKKAREEAALLEARSNFSAQPGVPVGSPGESGEKVVYLTIDDGPSALTSQVLDILDRYQAKATFFVTGAMPDYYHLIGEAYRRGHTIGLHTMTHDYAKVYASVGAYFADLEQIGSVVSGQIGYVPCFIRFPGGSSNQISANYSKGIMSTLVGAVQEKGYQYYDWNCSVGDGSVVNADQVVANGTSKSNQNIVLLCHDSQTKQATVDGLPRVIEHYQSQGYVFKALDRNSYAPHHGVGN